MITSSSKYQEQLDNNLTCFSFWVVMSIYSIGPELFISLSQPPDSVRTSIVTESVAGVNGYSFWQTGNRGESFQVESVVDLASFAACVAKYRFYETLKGSVQGVQWAALAQGNYFILDVRQVGPPRRVLSGVGGIGSGQYLLRCQWTMLSPATS